MEQPNSLKLEHLAEDIKPIIACVGNFGDYEKEIGQITAFEDIDYPVDFYSKPAVLTEHGYKNSGKETYVISTLDSKPKITKNLFDCTSLILVGRSIDDDRELSLLTHQSPHSFIVADRENFIADLQGRLIEARNNCTEGTVDVVIAGGHSTFADYAESVDVLATQVKEIFGFLPVIITGPKKQGGDDIYFDTANRRLYIVRPEVQVINESSSPEDVTENLIKWSAEHKKEEAEMIAKRRKVAEEEAKYL
jgi:hypothetical protein